MGNLEFSARQKRIVAAAVTVVGLAVILAAAVWGLVLLAAFLSFFSGVLLPLAVAGLLALMLRPIYTRLLRAVRWRALALMGTLLAVTLPILLLLWFFGAMLVAQLAALSEQVPVVASRALDAVRERVPALTEFWSEHGLTGKLGAWAQARSEWILQTLGSVGSGVLEAGVSLFRALAGWMSWLVLPVYLIFFLIGKPPRKETLEAALSFLKPETRRDILFLGGEFIGIVTAFFRGQLLVALAQGLLYMAGFTLIGLSYGLAIGLLMGLLNIIPYLGAMLGLMIALPVAFFQAGGGWAHLLSAGAVIAAVQTIEAYVLTPKIMGDRTGLHPVAILVAIFFWGTAFNGILGMILAIPLTAFLAVVWRWVRSKYPGEVGGTPRPRNPDPPVA